MQSETSGGKGITLRRLQFLLVLIGLFIAGYLSYLKLAAAPAACVEAGPFDCNVVLNSQYSELDVELAGRHIAIPIAYLGFAVYALIGLVMLFERKLSFMEQYGSLLVFGIGLFAWLFSMWLVYVQFFLLEALCPWCLSHETNFTLLFLTIAYRVYRETVEAEG